MPRRPLPGRPRATAIPLTRARRPPVSPPTGTHAALALPAAALSELQGSLRQSLQQVVKDQLADQRRFMLATFEAFARRMSSEIKEGMAKAPPPPAAEPMPPEPAPTPWWPVALTALLAAVPAAILGYLYWQATERTLGLSRELAESKSAVAAANAAAAAAAAVPVAAAAPPVAAEVAGATASAGPTAVEFVPYGEAPLAGARLERLRDLAATLEAEGFKGRILVQTFTGDFCLSGNAGEGFEPAAASLPTKDCDLVGNPFDDGLSPAQRQSVDFANFVATLRPAHGGRDRRRDGHCGSPQPGAVSGAGRKQHGRRLERRRRAEQPSRVPGVARRGARWMRARGRGPGRARR